MKRITLFLNSFITWTGLPVRATRELVVNCMKHNIIPAKITLSNSSFIIIIIMILRFRRNGLWRLFNNYAPVSLYNCIYIVFVVTEFTKPLEKLIVVLLAKKCHGSCGTRKVNCGVKIGPLLCPNLRVMTMVRTFACYYFNPLKQSGKYMYHSSVELYIPPKWQLYVPTCLACRNATFFQCYGFLVFLRINNH
jgi:hypothetical protein